MSAPLVALLCAALAVLLRLSANRRSAQDRRRLADEDLLRRYVRLPATAVPAARLALLGLGVGALALASRSSSSQNRRTDPEGIETILLLDASNSMLVEDLEPNRLSVQRALGGRLATRLAGRIGVVYFAGRAYVLSPLTTDANAIQMFVDGVRPAAVGLGGSSIASGLTQAIDLLEGGDENARKSIVLFSDGEETAGQPIQDAVDRARENGIVVHAVGLGTARGGQVPLTRDASLDPTTALRRRRGTAYLQGPDGETVVSKLEETVLQDIAAETGGRYVNGAGGIAAIEREIADGRGGPLPDSGNAAVGFLLLLAFASLWGEGFLLPRG